MGTQVAKQNTKCTPVPHPPLTSNQPPYLLLAGPEASGHGVVPSPQLARDGPAKAGPRSDAASDWPTEGCQAKRGLTSGKQTLE